MKHKVELTDEQLIARMKELSGVINENKEIETSKLLYQVKGPDFNNYGIMNEGSYFYIKASSIQSKDVLSESDFTYIGGLANKINFRYSSYSEALKNLNMMVKSETILSEGRHNYSEGYYDDTEEVVAEYQAPADEYQEQQPAPEQQQAPAPEQEVAPEQQQAPAPEGDYDPELEGPEGESGSNENIDHYVGKLTNLIRNTAPEEMTEVRIKSILNSVVASLPMDSLSPEDRLELAKRVKNGEDSEYENTEDYQEQPAHAEGGEEQAPAPEQEVAPEQQQAPAPEDDEQLQENDYLNINESINSITKNILERISKLK